MWICQKKCSITEKKVKKKVWKMTGESIAVWWKIGKEKQHTLYWYYILQLTRLQGLFEYGHYYWFMIDDYFINYDCFLKSTEFVFDWHANEILGEMLDLDKCFANHFDQQIQILSKYLINLPST